MEVRMSVKARLGIMMFLQYAIWGAWSPVLSAYLENTLHFSGMQIGIIYSLLPLATIISPFIGGQIADRYFSSEKVIAVLQLIGGGLLIYISQLSDYSMMMWMLFLYSLLYAPTMALTNSIAFINMKDSEKEFGQVRVWGTIGWIVAGLTLSGWRYLGNAPGADTLLLAGIFSLIMGVQSFTLPNTPPRKDSAKPWAFIEAIKMLKDKNVLVFTIIAFVVATELMFYYVLTAPFLVSNKIGVSSNNVAAVMVIAQAAEILVLAFVLPWALPKYGIRTVLTVGILAWPIRYIIFAIGSPAWLVIASLSLHGFCFVFFFAAAFIYFDTISPSDIRASAQSFITLVTYGVGNYVGSLFAGWIKSMFTTPEGVTNWTNVFLVPCALTILCAIAFLAFFRTENNKKAVKA
jgi:nucleoside transporter